MNACHGRSISTISSCEPIEDLGDEEDDPDEVKDPAEGDGNVQSFIDSKAVVRSFS
jgi:hypothetical protein